MVTITFSTGEELNVKSIWSRTATFQGADRKTLEIKVEGAEGMFDTLKSLYTNPESLSEMVSVETDDEGNVISTALHNGYTLPMELGLKSVDGEQQWTMKVAQKTALEIMQEQQAVDIEDTQLALIELAEIITGGVE